MVLKPDYFYNQSGVIPFRRDTSGLKILLITSLHRKRWIIPKGIIEDDLSPQESAEKEAFEEAGIKGRMYENEIGEYQYRKWGGICTVKVFLFEVSELLETWPESVARHRKWVSVEDAGKLVKEKPLKQLIGMVPTLISTDT